MRIGSHIEEVGVKKTVEKQETTMECLIVHSGAELYGSDRVVLESAIALIQSGHHVVVLLPSGGNLVGELHAAGARVLIGPSFVLRKTLLHPRNWPILACKALLGILCTLRTLRQVRPDIVLVNTTTLPMWPPFARLAGARVVSHIHEADSEMPLLFRRLLAAPHLVSQIIICNSEFTRDVLREAYPWLEPKISVIYNGVAAPPETTVARNDVSDSFRVLYIGRLSPRKGPDLLINAINELSTSGLPVQLVVAGTAFDGMEWFEDELHTAAAKIRGGHGVKFAGFHSNVWPLLAEADVLVVPSRLDESFGNTAVEGILAGRPVVVSDTSGLREAARGYRSAIYVAPDDSRSIADALQRIFENWTDYSTQAAVDAEVAERKHSLSTYRLELSEITTRS